MNEQLIDEVAELLSPAEASRQTGMDVRTLRRWARMGILDSVRTVGGQHRYRPADLRRLPKLNRRRRT